MASTASTGRVALPDGLQLFGTFVVRGAPEAPAGFGSYPATSLREPGAKFRVLVAPAHGRSASELNEAWTAQVAALQSIAPPHAAPVVAGGVAHGGLCLVVRVSNVGRSLRDVITATPSGFDAPDVVRVITELVEALDPLHKMAPPMVHRALCPESVWWDDASDGSVLLCDWAMAGSLAAVGVPLGEAALPLSSPYRSPENDPEGKVTPAADQFALATIAMELLTGRAPPPADAGEVNTTGLTGRAIHPTISAALARARALMARSRYPTVLGFAQALGAAAEQTRARAVPKIGDKTSTGSFASVPTKPAAPVPKSTMLFAGAAPDVPVTQHTAKTAKMSTVTGPNPALSASGSATASPAPSVATKVAPASTAQPASTTQSKTGAHAAVPPALPPTQPAAPAPAPAPHRAARAATLMGISPPVLPPSAPLAPSPAPASDMASRMPSDWPSAFGTEAAAPESAVPAVSSAQAGALAEPAPMFGARERIPTPPPLPRIDAPPARGLLDDLQVDVSIPLMESMVPREPRPDSEVSKSAIEIDPVSDAASTPPAERVSELPVTSSMLVAIEGNSALQSIEAATGAPPPAISAGEGEGEGEAKQAEPAAKDPESEAKPEATAAAETAPASAAANDPEPASPRWAAPGAPADAASTPAASNAKRGGYATPESTTAKHPAARPKVPPLVLAFGGLLLGVSVTAVIFRDTLFGTAPAPVASATATASVTPSAAPTAASTASAAPSATAAPTASAASAEPSATAAPSAAATASAEPSAAPSTEPTAVASATAAPSASAEPSATAAPTAEPTATAAPTASAEPTAVASAPPPVRPSGPLPERPDFQSRLNAQRTIQDAISRCEGHYGRHVRMTVTYESSGRPTQVAIAGSFWADKPVLPCIEAAARGATVSPFSRPTYEHDYSFEVH